RRELWREWRKKYIDGDSGERDIDAGSTPEYYMNLFIKNTFKRQESWRNRRIRYYTGRRSDSEEEDTRIIAGPPSDYYTKMQDMRAIGFSVFLLVRSFGRAVSFLQRAGLKEILLVTNNFSDENLITEGTLGKVYKGQLLQKRNVMNFFTVRRLDCKYGQGDELQTEISMLKSLKHKNIVSIFGYCDENNEKIIIYEDAFHGTLDQHLSDPGLTMGRRLQICLGVARALNYVHYDVIHCDINSSKIFLDRDWEPKIYGFELSTKYPQSWRHRLLFSRYLDTNIITPKYDVYSFGVLLLEVLCGRKPMITNDGVHEELDEIIDPNLRKQMDTHSLALFTNLAYNCLNQQHVQRPTMDQIVKELEEVLELQLKHANLEPSKAADEGTSSNNLKMDLLKIPLSKIKLATNNFDEEYSIGCGGYGIVYKAELDVLDVQSLSSMEGKCKDELPKINKTVAIKRILSRADEQGWNRGTLEVSTQ
ncbi:hypothetical protein M8C21_033972, partial [Ambrosia artemisiifolia]